MNFLNHTFAYEDLRDCTLITKNGTKIAAVIDYIESSRDAFPKFEGCIVGIEKAEPRLSYADYSRYYKKTTNYIPEIKNVIFNDPATIVFWEDGTKTVVKCQPGDSFDPEKGLAMAITKKTYGNKGSYCNQLKKWLPKEEPVDNNHIILRSISEPKKLTFTIDDGEFLKSFKKSISDALDVFKGTRCTPNIDPDCKGGVIGCPRDIKACGHNLEVSDDDCRACWDRVIPDESMDND